jgi:hypothetical protein
MQSERASKYTRTRHRDGYKEFVAPMVHAQIPSSCSARTLRDMLIKRQRDFIRLTIVHRPHRPYHRTEPSKLHRRREMDHLVRTLFISDSRMTRRDIRKFGVLEITPDDALDLKAPVMQSERGFERLFSIWETMTRKVDPFVLAKLFNDPRSQDSSPSIRVNVARPSTRWPMLTSSAPTERSSLSSAALA